MRCGLGDRVSGIGISVLCGRFLGILWHKYSGGLTLSTLDTSASDRIRASYTDEDTSYSPSLSNLSTWLSSTKLINSPPGHASQRLT